VRAALWNSEDSGTEVLGTEMKGSPFRGSGKVCEELADFHWPFTKFCTLWGFEPLN